MIEGKQLIGTDIVEEDALEFERRVHEWDEKGFRVLFDWDGDHADCILYKPYPIMGTNPLHKLDEFRGHGATPLKALIQAGREYGQSALFA